jgi:hypothetical protein
MAFKALCLDQAASCQLMPSRDGTGLSSSRPRRAAAMLGSNGYTAASWNHRDHEDCPMLEGFQNGA